VGETRAGTDPTRLIQKARSEVDQLLKAGEVNSGRCREFLATLDELEAVLKKGQPPTWKQVMKRNLPFITELIRLVAEMARGL